MNVTGNGHRLIQGITSAIAWKACRKPQKTTVTIVNVAINSRAIGQTVSSWQPGFGPRSSHVGFVAERVALGQVFSEYLVPLPILIPPTAPHSSSIIWGW
jgi:hypothetical protein